uniref:Uncharacterized protein n=1 Tax=uncultured prokaryote TaxID=198431 RepID=A0A0H5Q7L2_9ZZZZ|nr:hypothetical protein [uncultured prokaryote]
MSAITITISRFNAVHPNVVARARVTVVSEGRGTTRPLASAVWPQEAGVSARDTLKAALWALLDDLETPH